MDPKKRADCEEIVSAFTKFHDKCLTEGVPYCTESVKGVQRRARTDLSLLYASAFEFSPEMDKKLKRYSRSDSTDSRESNPTGRTLETTARNRGTDGLSGITSLMKMQPESEIRASAVPKRMDTITEPTTSSPTTVVASEGASNNEQMLSRTQSPNLKVHFEIGQQSKGLELSENKGEVETMQIRLPNRHAAKETGSKLTQVNDSQPKLPSEPPESLTAVSGFSPAVVPPASATYLDGPSIPRTEIGNDLMERTSTEHLSKNSQTSSHQSLCDSDTANSYHSSDRDGERYSFLQGLSHDTSRPGELGESMAAKSSSQKDISKCRTCLKSRLKRCKSLIPVFGGCFGCKE